MIKQMFSIRDTKSAIYSDPFYAITHGVAERNFHEIANDSSSIVYKHPEDFDLYHIGEFDDNTGKCQILETPKHVMKAVHCRKNQQNVQPTVPVVN